MSLKGSLDSFSLDEVLTLIAAGRKTGTLQVRGDRGVGAVYFNGGRACGAEAGRHSGPIEDVEPLLVTRLQDVCFELFRFTEGDFIFEAGRLPEWAQQITLDIDIQFLVSEVKRRVTEWAGIQAVIPSAEARPKLVAELPFEDVTLDRWQWRLIAAIDGRRRVNAIMRTLHMSEFDCCRAVKELVEAELVEIELPGEESAGAGPPMSQPQVARAPMEPVRAAPAPAPAPPAEVAERYEAPAPQGVVEAPPARPEVPAGAMVDDGPFAPVHEPSLSEPVAPPAPAAGPTAAPMFGGAFDDGRPAPDTAPAAVQASGEQVFEVNLADETFSTQGSSPTSLLEQGLEDPLPPRNGSGAARPDVRANPAVPVTNGSSPVAQVAPDPAPMERPAPEAVAPEPLEEALAELRGATLVPVEQPDRAHDVLDERAEDDGRVADEQPLARPVPVDDNIRAAAAAELAGLGSPETPAREDSRRRRGPSLSPVREA